MSVRTFVDTNVLVYAHDIDQGSKRSKAAALIKQLWDEGTGVLSTQVLQEFYVNVTRKIPQPLSPAQARGVIETYRVWLIEVNDVETILKASEIEERYELSFWDALIIAAARNARAKLLLTEDLNHGQIIEGVEIRNPFKGSSPGRT